MIDKAILGGDVYLDGTFQKTNIYIVGEKIFAISKEFLPAKETIDAKNLQIIPGLIDPHVHFDLDLGFARSVDNFENGSMIAALGGVTTIVDFLDPVDNEIDLEKAFRRRLFEAEDSKIDYKFHATIKEPRCELNRFVEKMLDLGINTLKCFTTYSESGRKISDEAILELLKLSQKYKFMLLVHAEKDSEIQLNSNWTFRDLPKSRPARAEIEEALELAGFVQQVGGYLYLVHVSSGDTIEQLKIDYFDLLNRHLFLESCPQYFLFNDSMCQSDHGYLYTMAPPLRSERERVWLNENIDFIQCIGTDHCAFTKDEKQHELLYEIPLGVGGIEHSFDVMYHKFKEKIIDKMTRNVALLHRLETRKGRIKVGLDADLFFYDPKPMTIQDDHSFSNYTIYQGCLSSGQVVSTLLRGEFVVRDRVFMSTYGKYLKAGED
ncbi:MAG: amidohydrolase family protein [Candidatus Izemoplasmatales bacterium]|jgi:dihydropyrimidinase|nr:amidohydrolase family protein [Candidatus Izemoplasmatales bacterium]MDD4988445.1 amidohydrolase family protein [Candidatus Izemoplasmatales bacterium]NLF48407.1 amidohydrolase family protein [Acholeplasmataceae bacterium]